MIELDFSDPLILHAARAVDLEFGGAPIAPVRPLFVNWHYRPPADWRPMIDADEYVTTDGIVVSGVSVAMFGWQDAYRRAKANR